MFWIIFIGILVIALGIGYGIRSREVGKKVAARDFLRGIISLTVIIIVLIGLGLLGVPLKVNRRMIISLIGIAFVCASAIILLRWKKKTGAVLLDIGRSTQHKMFLVAGGMFLLSGIIELVGLFETGSKTRINDAISCLLLLWCGVLFALLGKFRLEIREGGIMCVGNFVKWQQIKSYEWEGKNNLTLTLRLKRRFSIYRRFSLPVPALHKETVEKLLEQYLQSDKNIS
jgi:hypothetical protein